MTSTLPTVSESFAIAVEASYNHMRQHHRTTRNQDDYDAGVKMLVELTPPHCAFCGKDIWLDEGSWRHDSPGSMPICNYVPQPKGGKQ